jgi:hypothetical protein
LNNLVTQVRIFEGIDAVNDFLATAKLHSVEQIAYVKKEVKKLYIVGTCVETEIDVFMVTYKTWKTEEK